MISKFHKISVSGTVRLNRHRLVIKSAFGVFLIINLLLLSQSAAQVTLTNDKTHRVTLLSLNQIPESGNYTRQLINQVENFIEQKKDLGRISEEVENMFNLLNEKLELLGDSSRSFNRYQLDKNERELNLMNQQFDRWQQNTQQINAGRINNTG
jgi:arginyl-tRNA synthetase